MTIVTTPLAETPRLTLRNFVATDAAFVLALVNDPDWIRFIGDRNVHSLDDAQTYIENRLMAAYARQAKDSQLIEYATEIKVRAERRAGAMLTESAANGTRATASKGRPSEVSNASTLTEIGITRDDSSRWPSANRITG